MTNTLILLSLLFLVIIVVSNIDVATASTSTRHLNERDDITGHISSSAEEILSKRQQRKEEFTIKLEEFQKQLDDHHSNQFILTQPEVNRINRKIKAYETKIGQLSSELSDKHIDRLLDREALLNEMHRARMEKSEL